MKIWIDADACPRIIKEHIFKMANKFNIPTVLVANSHMKIPLSPNLSFVHVNQGADVADSYIVEHLEKGDIVITADIPLAALVVEKEAIGINPRGEIYTEENIAERLSMRNFMQELRDSGIATSGPEALGPKDKENFANAFNKVLAKL